MVTEYFITLVDLQLDALNSSLYIYILHLLKSSTCFEHYPAHLQDVYVVIVYITLWYRHYWYICLACLALQILMIG